jgi:hypothetical protein
MLATEFMGDADSRAEKLHPSLQIDNSFSFTKTRPAAPATPPKPTIF